MPRFLIKAEETVVLMYEVEATDLAIAIQMVEDDEVPGAEIDSRGPCATEYTVGGQMGWSPVP